MKHTPTKPMNDLADDAAQQPAAPTDTSNGTCNGLNVGPIAGVMPKPNGEMASKRDDGWRPGMGRPPGWY